MSAMDVLADVIMADALEKVTDELGEKLCQVDDAFISREVAKRLARDTAEAATAVEQCEQCGRTVSTKGVKAWR